MTILNRCVERMLRAWDNLCKILNVYARKLQVVWGHHVGICDGCGTATADRSGESCFVSRQVRTSIGDSRALLPLWPGYYYDSSMAR